MIKKGGENPLSVDIKLAQVSVNNEFIQLNNLCPLNGMVFVYYWCKRFEYI